MLFIRSLSVNAKVMVQTFVSSPLDYCLLFGIAEGADATVAGSPERRRSSDHRHLAAIDHITPVSVSFNESSS